MTKTLLATLLVLLLAAGVLANEQTYLIPLKSDLPIAVDGDLRDWASVPGATPLQGAEHVTWGASNWTGREDLGGTVHLAWRQEGIYLGVEVIDDVVAQTQRGPTMFRGDHIELFIDVNPDPQRPPTTFGPQQFQFAFSPGNFGQTGDPLFHIQPEAYPYEPQGASTEGVRLAVSRTPQGYDLEAFIPFSLIGVSNPAPGTLLAGEVAISDTDSAEPAQQSFMTLSTEPWAHNPTRFVSLLLGDATGRATAPPPANPNCRGLGNQARPSGRGEFRGAASAAGQGCVPLLPSPHQLPQAGRIPRQCAAALPQ